MSKLTDKTALASTKDAPKVLVHVVDPSDATDDAAGTSKKAALEDLPFGKIQGWSSVISLAGVAFSGNLQHTGIAAYVDGGIYWAKSNNESVNASTLNFNGIGAKPIRKSTTAGTKHLLCTLGDMVGSSWYQFVYSSLDGGGFYLQNPRYPDMVVAEYDFSADGGAISTINLTGNVVPASAIVDVNNVMFQITTAPTSAGTNPIITMGFGAGINFDAFLSDMPASFDGWAQTVFKGRNIKVGFVQLTAGAGGSVNDVQVSGTDILNSTSVAYNTSRAQTATDVATDINKNPKTTVYAIAQDEWIYLYVLDIGKFKRQVNFSVASSTTTLSTLSSNIGVAGGTNPTNLFKVGAAAVPVSITVANNALTAGKWRVFIPILPNVL
jgi:hypothetical protein